MKSCLIPRLHNHVSNTEVQQIINLMHINRIKYDIYFGIGKVLRYN